MSKYGYLELFLRVGPFDFEITRVECICKLNSRVPSPIYGDSAVGVFVLLFSFSIFSDRRSLKIENENNSMKR